MKRAYRKEYPELKEFPKETIYGIYIIPYKAYNGFWGKNGFKSYDFIFETKGRKKIGWLHWEGDVISLYNNKCYGMRIDTAVGDDYIRIFNDYGFDLKDFQISSASIISKEKEDD